MPDQGSTPRPQNEADVRLGHSILIGAITMAWNDAHETVFRLFHHLSGMPKPMAEGVFFSLNSDRAQRDITRAVARATTAIAEEWKVEAIRLLGQLDQKSGERNAAIHTMWDDAALSKGEIAPSSEISPLYHNKNLKPDVVKQFKDLIREIMIIGLGLLKIHQVWELSQPSPDRQPQQPPMNTASDSGRDRPTPSEGTARPPQSSQA